MEPSTYDAFLNEEQALIRSTVAEFAKDRVAPRMEALEKSSGNDFPEDLWREMAALGLFGVFVPGDRGGAGAGFLAHAALIEALARRGGSIAALVLAQGIVVDACVRADPTLLPAGLFDTLVSGKVFAAAALSEDDDSRISCRAEGSGTAVRLTGTKRNVAFPGRAACHLVLADHGGERLLALVSGNARGLVHGPREGNLGLAAFPAGMLALDQTPAVALGGVALLNDVLAGVRIAVAALLAGVAREALEHALRYADERKQFGLTLKSFAAIEERLARSDARVEALLGMTFGAARARDLGEPSAQAALRARLLASEVAIHAADDALQVYGGYGFSREYPVERCYRDARFTGFGEHHPRATYRELVRAME